MYYQNLKYSGMFIVLAFFAFTLLTSCEEEENGDPNKDETEVWQSYEFTPNTSFEYDIEFIKAGEEQKRYGNAVIEIGDPEVTISGIIDGHEFEMSENTSSDIEDNFEDVIIRSPLSVLRTQNVLIIGFHEQELEVGASWTHKDNYGSVEYEITGKDTYVEREGYVVEITMVNSDGEATTVDACIDPNLPISMMIEVDYGKDEDWYIMELTSYED